LDSAQDGVPKGLGKKTKAEPMLGMRSRGLRLCRQRPGKGRRPGPSPVLGGHHKEEQTHQVNAAMCAQYEPTMCWDCRKDLLLGSVQQASQGPSPGPAPDSAHKSSC
jgi:hypothetical protein